MHRMRFHVVPDAMLHAHGEAGVSLAHICRGIYARLPVVGIVLMDIDVKCASPGHHVEIALVMSDTTMTPSTTRDASDA